MDLDMSDATDANGRLHKAEDAKIEVQRLISEGASLLQVAEQVLPFKNALQAADLAVDSLQTLVAGDGVVLMWFTGGKGFRVACFHPQGYFRFHKGDKNISARARDGKIVSILGEETMRQMRQFCDVDKNIYDVGKGVKTDLQRHHDTGFYPYLVTNANREEPMKRDSRDPELCEAIPWLWDTIFNNIPAWEDAE
jgi:hypothetical protein